MRKLSMIHINETLDTPIHIEVVKVRHMITKRFLIFIKGEDIYLHVSYLYQKLELSFPKLN